MDDEGQISAWGGLINSALFLAMVFTAGLVWHDHLAVDFCILAVGMTLCAYSLRLAQGNTNAASIGLSIGSWIAGIIAGALLLLGR